MRRFLLPALVLAVLAPAPSAFAGTLFVLTGKGWGHGVGMSQWGAYGLAKQGKDYKAILGHYYAGTTVARRATRTVSVQLAAGASSLSLGSAARFTVTAGTRSEAHPAGNATVTRTSKGRIKVQGISGTFASPATFSPSSSPLRVGSSRYRGKLVVRLQKGALRLLNRLGMEPYVRGVVPRESPSSWPAGALRAQAVAARSYALYELEKGGMSCSGAFCPDTSDQVYGGLDAETAATNASVADTAREVVVDGGGNVAQTFFHSSSGGRTASSADVWGGVRSYLKSVKDSADLNSANYHRSWRELRSARELRSQLGLARTPRDGTVTRNGSGRVETLRFPGSAPVALGDDMLRYRLGVDSTRFWLGVLRLSASDRRVEWRTRVDVSAFVRAVANSTLRQRRYGGSWTEMQPVAGSASVRVRPRSTTTFRLGSPAVRGVTVRVRVTPRLRFNDAQSATALSGIMRPRRAGTQILVQKRRSGGWRTVATTTLAGDGTWKASLAVVPGVYRAYAAPGKGLAPGTSPTLRIVGG